MGLDIKESDKAARVRATQILKEWVRTGVVAIYEEHDARQGRVTKLYCQGETILTQ
jgi:hypothetical protein